AGPAGGGGRVARRHRSAPAALRADGGAAGGGARPVMQPGAQQIQCEGCGYDLAGLGDDGACPECGRPMRPSTCRGCGYSLAGLDVEGVCPECGRPVRDSLTRRRRGSPWQRAPGVGSWVMTTAGLLVSPRSFWDDVRVEEWKSWNLMNV